MLRHASTLLPFSEAVDGDAGDHDRLVCGRVSHGTGPTGGNSVTLGHLVLNSDVEVGEQLVVQSDGSLHSFQTVATIRVVRVVLNYVRSD